MRYNPLPVSFYQGNRASFMKKMKSGAMALFQSNDVPVTNADGTLMFCQNTDLFYMTGVDQEETTLLLWPEAPKPELKEILFLRETNERVKIWEGAKLTKEEARALTGIQTIYWLSEYDRVLDEIAAQVSIIYLNKNEHLRAESPVETRDVRLGNVVRAQYPNHTFERIAPLTAEMRQVKQSVEIEAIKKACDITEIAVRRVLKFVKPGVGEWEIEAELAHEFIRHGARRWGFCPIIASGQDTCVLHYLANDKVCQDGDLVLMDIGTEYGNYNSDLTRTFPVSGKFTPRQKAVYDAVYRVHKYALSIMAPGMTKREYEGKIGQFMEKELLELGLISQKDIDQQNPATPAYRRYYMHGTSHFLGLDVHDVGEANPVFVPGMVFTIEPGIYIPEENIGIRLENDVLITEKGAVDLMPNIPLSSDDVERAMSE